MATPFPDSSSSPWQNPDNGITYVFKDDRWRADLFVDAEYTLIAGDTMTGDLTAPNFESGSTIEIAGKQLTVKNGRLMFEGKKVLQKF